MKTETYTLADLATFTGAGRRTVQLWAEAGAIRADQETERAGTGTHRRFSRTEAIIACILYAFASKKISIGVLIDIGKALRDILKEKDSRTVIEYAMRTGKPAYLIFAHVAQGNWAGSLFHPWLQKGENPDVADGMAQAFDSLDEPGSMTFIIKVNTYLKNMMM